MAGKATPVATDMARPANEERGELSLRLDDTTMGLRPSYEAIEAIEAGTGKGLVTLATAAARRELDLASLALIATECIRAWGRANDDRGLAGSNVKRIAELILDSEGGLVDAMATVGAVLALAVTGKYTAAGELKPTTTKTTDGAPVVG